MQPLDPSPAGPAKRPRVSVFRETGLFDDDDEITFALPPVLATAVHSETPRKRPSVVRFRSNVSIVPCEETESEWEDVDDSDLSDDDESVAAKFSRRYRSSVPVEMYRLAMIVLLLAVALPIVQTSTLFGTPDRVMLGAKGRVVRQRAPAMSPNELEIEHLAPRQDTPTDVCKRWSHQTAIVNGTLYIYGGRSSTEADQQDNTWNNHFLTLDLTKSWQISTPSLTGLPQPSGPPAISNGYMWNSYDSLYLYGGEFSDNPVASPLPFSMWEYNIGAKEWREHSEPRTSSGQFSEKADQPVQRSAEGAGFSVAKLGRGWYFGGHLDGYTTEGWSQSIPRIYLSSLIEYTFPGATNSGVDSLSDGKTAGVDGVWRNITDGGVQDTAGFPERADGVLAYVPGFAPEGIIIGLTGGTNATFTQMNIIDVYDIATSTWYKQTTSGKTPKARVNPCVVVAAAADGTSYNVYMFGGQNLVPYKEQIQYDDMWILSIPSFKWIEVTTDSQVPPPRAGHTCNIWDGQMIVVGGYVGQDLSCDSPGIYVFNLSSLAWEPQFTALTGQQSLDTNNADSNPFSQQNEQKSQNDIKMAGLEGSYGYRVPDVVAAEIGGGPTGGATITVPVQTPTAGPLATGQPLTYTITAPDGSIITGTSSPNGSNSGGTNKTVAIVVGVIAGIFAIVAAYFAFCALVYRKQLQLYKNHELMAGRANAGVGGTRAEKAGLMPPGSSGARSSDHTRTESQNSSFGPYAAGATAMAGAGAGAGRQSVDRRSTASSTDDLLAGMEPSFWGVKGVLLNPRRSLRVINRD